MRQGEGRSWGLFSYLGLLTLNAGGDKSGAMLLDAVTLRLHLVPEILSLLSTTT